MNKIKRAYYYLFYKFYKMSEAAPSRWMSDWKAGLVIIVLELFLIASIANYYTVFIDRTLPLAELSNLSICIWVLIIVIPNYFAFVNTNVWKDYVREFDQLPKSVNRKGTLIVLGITLFVAANFIFSFYLYFRT